MLIDPDELVHDLDRIEAVEKASLRLVVQAMYDFRETAQEIFLKEKDKPDGKAEDATREALDSVGVSRIPVRLFGKTDYKRARYVFDPHFAVKQALLVDSKAEKGSDTSARINITQTSMTVRQIRKGKPVSMGGLLPVVLDASGARFLTTTIFVKYGYRDLGDLKHSISRLTLAALPNGMLQERYNPSTVDGIWIAGPDAPSRGEKFRTRLGFSRLKEKCGWRVQHIPMAPDPFVWSEGTHF